jgi:hypothetical protein
MTRVGVVLLLAAAVLLAGCSLLPTTPGPHLPAPAADDMVQRQSVGSGDGFVTFLPASPTGAILGTEYDYTMPHCGVLGPIDVDGSFWDAKPGGGGPDGQAGEFRLVTPSDAVFTAHEGGSVSLTRHDGPKRFSICS